MDVSVVIITYNSWSDLQRCLDSVNRHFHRCTYEVIVVDNHSTDGTADKLRSGYPQIVLIENPENLGVARARNRGFGSATGRYVLILDADIEIVSDTLDSLVAYMDARPDVGILGCTLVSVDHQLHPSARTFPRPIHVLLRRLSFTGLVKEGGTLRKHHLADWDRKSPRQVDMVEGAFQLIRKEVIEEIGPLDERMFYGFEDADYCARAAKAGYRVVCHPSFTAIHVLQGITRRNPFGKIAVNHFLSYLRFYRKHRRLILGKDPVAVQEEEA